MPNVAFYSMKLRLLQSWLCNKIDGLECGTLDDIYYKQQVTYEMNEINKGKERDKAKRVVFVTDHAYHMAKERLSMNRVSFEKLSEKAYLLGVNHSEVAGNLKRYIDKKFLSQRSANNIRIYGENIFIFSKQTLITVYQIPLNLKKSALKCRANKK